MINKGMNNFQRKNNQLPYTTDDICYKEQKKARKLIQKIAKVDRSNFKRINKLIAKLFGKSENAFVIPPFFCDYGSNIFVGKNFFANSNCTILDVAKVTIGNNCFLAPNVSIYTAGHPIHPEIRSTGIEYGIEVVIGNDVWIGGNSVICPGVHIGNGCVIGAGSVVTKDIPDNTIAAGNPCKVIRSITDKDKEFYFKDRKFDSESWAFIQKKLNNEI